MQRWIWLFVVSALGALAFVGWHTLPNPGASQAAPVVALPGGGGPPTPCPGGLTIPGWITAAEPTQVGRLTRDGTPTTCMAPKPCPTVIDATGRHYRSHAFINNTSNPQCVTISLNTNCSGFNTIFSAVYLNNFQSGDVCANYLGDIGTSPLPTSAYSITVPAGATFMVVVSEVNPNAGCPDYTLQVTGCISLLGPSPTPTVPPTATPTCVVQQGGWEAGANLPAARVRALGLTYHLPTPTTVATTEGRAAPDTFHVATRFLALGGSNGVLPQRGIYEYSPITDTWTLKAAQFDDNHVVDMEGATFPLPGGGSVVYTVGGWDPLAQTTTNKVRVYDPQADTLTVLTSDPWPPGGTNTLPGTAAVWNNRLYIIGGYRVNSGMSDEIWEFNPNGSVGQRWQLKQAQLPVALGYLSAATIGSGIFVGGGVTYAAGALIDSALGYVYSPVGDAIAPISNLRAPTSHTHGANVDGEFWVFGGTLGPPGPTNRVQIYNPGTDNWRWGPQFITARRNAALDIAAGHYVFMAGGQTAFGPTSDMENYHFAETCGNPTPTPPVSPTPTPCAVTFVDVPLTHPFYPFIRCLACLGIVSGYACGGPGEPCPGLYFRPSFDVTRAQLAKIVANSIGINDPIPPGYQTFTDVPSTNGFYAYIEWVAGHGILSGYQCGGVGEPCDAQNRPYFRPNNNATRGQISKIVANAAQFNEPVSGQTFTDVPPNSTFYWWVERIASRGIISGYTCGGPGEPCDAQNRPYFRPNNSATRAQLAKIVANAFYPGCNPPARR